MNIIIADDSTVVRSIVAKVITSIGHQALHTAHGGEVIEMLEERGSEIDIILMDWNMPIMDGFEALQKIKADSRFSSIPVIMLTSESDEDKIKMAYDAGVTGYVEKPFTQDELVEYLEKVIKETK